MPMRPPFFEMSRPRRRNAAAAALTFLILHPVASTAATIHVDADAPGSVHNGVAWCTAYNSLAAALTAAVPGTVIRVAAGTYRPDPAGLADPRAAVFRLKAGVALHGGFAGCGAADPDSRDIASHEAILSGDLGADDVGDLNNGENAYHVVTGNLATSSTVLDGFTITGGNANGPSSDYYHLGGGMLNNGGSPIVSNCLFRANRAASGGGGAHNRFSADPKFLSCRFEANHSDAGGGGMHNYSVNPRVIACSFDSNDAIYGGGVYNQGSQPLMVDCLFLGNSAERGGGLRNYAVSQATFINCRFLGNRALEAGGGVENRGGTHVYTNCVFSGNISDTDGGAMSNDAYAKPTITNCTFSRNVTANRGGGLYQTHLSGGSPKLRNCILWNNQDAGGMDESAQIHTSTGTPEVYSSCVMGEWTGVGSPNIGADPRFIDDDGPDGMLGTEDDDPAPGTGSPCVDAGNNSYVPSDTADVDADGNRSERLPEDRRGQPRFQDDSGVADTGVPDPPIYPQIVDMGAHERTHTPLDVPGWRDAARGGLSLAAMPNPFHEETAFRLELGSAALVELSVLDLAGRRVATVAKRQFEPGTHTLRWDGRDVNGRRAAPGLYFARAAYASGRVCRALVRLR